MTLNEAAARLADELAGNADRFRVAVHEVSGARVIDCGVSARGGLDAGLRLAEICLGGLGTVSLVPGGDSPLVQVWSDQPVRACLLSQYAGWQVSAGGYFGMGSGPFRAAYAREEVFAEQNYAEKDAPRLVGVLEGKLPTPEAVETLAAKLGRPASALTLLAARTKSIAGGVQVVARSLETALHKLHALHFPLDAVVSGHGSAPLPPPGRDDMASIGRTNDAILYGGRVALWVDCDDAVIDEIGPRVPSSASPDFGGPFAEVLRRAGGDFYKIDPMLFSPAEVRFVNLRTGRASAFGGVRPDVLAAGVSS
jgi:methenyltetrahydromethanopterin cyclohydrolase